MSDFAYIISKYEQEYKLDFKYVEIPQKEIKFAPETGKNYQQKGDGGKMK